MNEKFNLNELLISGFYIKFNDITDAELATRAVLTRSLLALDKDISVGTDDDIGDAYYEIEFLKEFSVAKSAFIYMLNDKLFVSNQYDGEFKVDEDKIIDFDDKDSHADSMIYRFTNSVKETDNVFTRMSEEEKAKFYKLPTLQDQLNMLLDFATNDLEKEHIRFAILGEKDI